MGLTCKSHAIFHAWLQFVRRANEYVEAGVIDECYRIEETCDESMKIKAVYILGMMCFNNEVSPLPFPYPPTSQFKQHSVFLSTCLSL